jgi:hypothetical protein
MLSALRALVADRLVDDHAGRRAHLEQLIAGESVGLVELVELEGIEPDAHAAVLADVELDAPDGHRGERAVAGGTFHE